VVPLLLQATKWCLQLEWPQEVVGLLEMWANGHDLMDKILDAYDVVTPEARLNDIVVAQRNPLLVQLSITPLVNQFPYTLQVWIPEDKILDVSGYTEA